MASGKLPYPLIVFITNIGMTVAMPRKSLVFSQWGKHSTTGSLMMLLVEKRLIIILCKYVNMRIYSQKI